MPKPAIVTAESVRAAAAELIAKGQQPSVRRVRELIGGGNPNTINAVLRELRNEALAAPMPIDDAVARAIRAQIARAREEACTQLEERLAAAESDVVALTATGEAAARQIAELAAAVADSNAQRNRLAGQLEEARARTDQLQAAFDRAAEAHKQELEELRERLAAALQGQAIAEMRVQHERELREAVERTVPAAESGPPSAKARRRASAPPARKPDTRPVRGSGK